MSPNVRESRARAVADLAAGTVLASVEIARPADRVFRALTEPRELMAWWGSPETYRAHSWTADFRVGGRWRCDGKSADGRPYSVQGEFLEIVPPRRLVQTWQYDWEQGQPETKLTYTLDEIPGGTRLTVRHEGFRSQEGCASHAQGWERVLEWLVAYIDAYDRPGL
jgi:uncharacterized protein YndB with AHSA1/START domain